jgi:hypothetical protein
MASATATAAPTGLVSSVAAVNTETQIALNALAAWLAAGSPLVVVPPGPTYIALGTGPMNLLTAEQADFETGTTGWAAVSNCSIAQSSSFAWSNVFSMKLTASSSGTITAGTPTGTSGVAVTQGDTVEAYSYMAAAHVLAGSTGRTVTMSILWYNSAGTLLSTTTGTGAADATSGWARVWVYGAAPSNTAFAAVEISVAGCSSSEVHYVDAVQFAYAPDGPYAWATGGVSGAPQVTDIALTQERAATRAGIDQATSQAQLALLIHTYQLTDPSGTFQEAGLFDSPCATVSLETQANAGTSTLTLAANAAPAVASVQQIYIATNPLTPPAAPTFNGASTTGGYLTGGDTYYYVITATNSLGQSTVGAEASYAVPSGTNTNQITLTWAAIPNASGYNVFRGTSSGTEQLLASVTNPTYTDNTNATPSGAQPTYDTSGGGGEYAVVATAASAGAATWALTDLLLRSHPVGAVITVFNGNLWAHTAVGYGLSSAATKTSQQLMTAEWQMSVENS